MTVMSWVLGVIGWLGMVTVLALIGAELYTMVLGSVNRWYERRHERRRRHGGW